MRARAVEIVLGRCLGLGCGEAVLVVTDPGMEAEARAFHRHARALGWEAALLSMPPPRSRGEEPPSFVAEALRSVPAAVLLTTASLSHTRARREACERHGTRAVSMPGADPARLEALLDVDYDALRSWCEELAGRLESGRRVRLASKAGTDLFFEIAGRPVFRDAGDFTRPGAFGNLPAGEVCLAPREGTAEGVLRVDGTIAGMGLPDRPVTLRFSGGRAVEVDDARLRRLLEEAGPEAYHLGEFGIGANPRAAVVGNILEDEKAIGTVHLALGSNHALGGRLALPFHADLVLREARVEIDGRPLPEKFLTPRPPAPSDPGAVELDPAEVYKSLFENSNDPQYVLDLQTQRFLEANPAFEELTGYTRAELLSGACTAPQLVARESLPTFYQKHESRRINPAERYELRILTKGGEKKPAELSVRRITLGGREVVVGAVRDLSSRKKLEQKMWEQIEELGRANSRIFALTEKIRRVPELTPKLLDLDDEKELLERTAALLCAREGLGYADANFYLLRGDALELVHSTLQAPRRRLALSEDHRLVRVFRGADPGGMTDREAVLPLKGRRQNIGVLEVFFHPKEIEVLRDNERALKGYRDLLETLSSLIGLLVDNLRLYDTVRRQSIVDHLTGVYNRRYLDQKLAEEISRASRYGRALALIMLDVDRFKEINDRMSYKQGDLVLVETARLFRSQTRDADLVCRYGGDEFVILLPETGYEQALAKAESLRLAVRGRDFTNTADPSRPLRLTLSLGVTAHHPGIRSPDEVLRAADEALHHAKRAGRDRVFGCFQGTCGPLPPAEGKAPAP